MDIPKKRRKRGEGSVSQYKKKRRSEGKSYEGNNKQTVPPKPPPSNEVVCQCRYECKNIGYEQKINTFNQFYSLANIVKQNSYLMGLLGVTDVKRRRHGSYKAPEESRRQATVFFSLPDGKGKHAQVCKKTFLEVHGITKRRVETLVAAKKRGEVTYIERRGNKTKERKYTAEDVKLITDHIESLPKEESHYTRAKSSNLFLSEDLNYNKLHTAFRQLHHNTTVQYRFYTETVRKHFPNLRFRKPRQDTCNTCDLLHNKIKNDQRNKQLHRNLLEIHHRKAERAREMMEQDHKESTAPLSDTCTFSVDLQQVFSLPTLTHCQMYYLRQLSCFNLGLHMADNNQGFMFVWHEGLSGWGGNEIASCIFRGIKSKITNKKKIIVWSDNCGGQNKNKMLLFLWIYLVSKNYVDEVQHKYVVPGHSYLSCDRNFGLIEERKRVEKCEVPLDVVRLLSTACTKKPFVTTLMGDEDFYDFSAAAKSCLNTTTLIISKVVWVKVTNEKPGTIYTKKTFSDDEQWVETKVFKKEVTNETIRNFELPRPGMTSRLTPEKKEDLKKMIPYLKEENKPFYTELTQ